LREGDLMRIEGGALDGLVGHFVRAKKGHRMVVSVTLLQRSVSVELDPSQVVPIRSGNGRQCA
jgi:transcription antitermination factor NusG